MALAMELYPKGSAGDGEGEADFRIRQGDKAWACLEVAKPDSSDRGADQNGYESAHGLDEGGGEAVCA